MAFGQKELKKSIHPSTAGEERRDKGKRQRMASLPPSSAAVSSSICQSSSFSERRCGDYSISRLFRLSRNKTTHLLPCSSLKISANDLPSSSPQRNGNRRRKPNAVVLDAQARVCTGPTQTRPLDEEKAFEVLRTIVQSGEYLNIK